MNSRRAISLVLAALLEGCQERASVSTVGGGPGSAAGPNEPISVAGLHNVWRVTGKLLSGSWDQTVRSWDLSSGRELARFRGAEMVVGIAFSPFGRRVPVTQREAANLLRAETMEEILTLRTRSPADSIHSLAFDATGGRLTAATRDSYVVIWDADDGPTPGEDPAKWHRRQIEESEQAQDHFAVGFHRRQLTALCATEVTTVDGFLRRGRSNESRGRLDAARADYDAAERLDPNDHSALMSRDCLRLITNDLQGAIGDFIRCIEVQPKGAGWYHRAGVHANCGKWTEVARDYAKVIELGDDAHLKT